MDGRDGATRRHFIQRMAAAGLTIGSGALPAMVSGAVAAGTGFDRRRWWEQEYRIVQTNLREIDAREDPRAIARAVREFGGNVIVTNIGGIVAFYPSKLTYQYVNPYLRGDFAHEMIAAAHAEGLAVIGRFDLSKAMKPAHDAHPDWFMLNRDGNPREYAGTYQACPNGGWAQSYAREILAEAVKLHATDGLFFNMTGYPQTDYSNVDHGICVCDNCHRRFRAMYGLELPATEGFRDPNWLKYLEFQDRTSAALIAETNAFIAGIRDVPITGFYAFDKVGRGEVQRRVDRAAPEWPYQSGEQTRWIMARNPGRPVSSTSAAHIDYPWRQVTETAACHKLRLAQALGVGAKLDLYLMGTIADQDDQSWLTPLSDLYKWHAANERSYAGLVPDARIALYMSDLTARLGGATPWGKYVTPAFRGAYGMLVDSRLPFWMVSNERVADGTTILAGAYDVVVMPHVLLLSDAEAKALDAFVDAGGLLITTGFTGGFTPAAAARAAPVLACFPGAAFGTPVDAHGWSIDDDKGALRSGGARIPIDGPYFPVTMRPGATSLIPLAPDQRFGPPEFSYAIPDAARRSDPAIVVRRFGKGMAVHLPWLPDWQYHRDGLQAHQRLIAALVARYAPPAPYVLEGSGAVEMMAMRQPATGHTLIHVVNYAGQRNGRYDDPPSLGGFRLGVHSDRGMRARALVAGRDMASSGGDREPGRLWFDLPPIGAFEAIELSPA